MTGRTRAIAAAVLLSIGLTAGCADEAPSAIDQDAHQAWALGDGEVTEEEYREAVDNFIGCMADAGYGVTKPVLSPIDDLTLLFDFQPTGDVDAYNTKLDSCNETQFTQIEPAYVEPRQQVMDPALRKATAECLVAKGLSVAGDETNVRGFMNATGATLSGVMDCVTPAAHRLFPDLPDYIKVRA